MFGQSKGVMQRVLLVEQGEQEVSPTFVALLGGVVPMSESRANPYLMNLGVSDIDHRFFWQCRCNTDGQVVIQEMAKHPLEKKVDASCSLVKEMFSSGCLELSTEDCGTEKRCMWDNADGKNELLPQNMTT